MKTVLLILSIAFFASCSTAYKSGQTPDDTYYSKPRPEAEVTIRKQQYQEEVVQSYDDRQIRMAIRDQRWRSLDYDYDYDCRYNPYAYGYNYGYYYNPYYYPYPVYTGGVKYVNPKNTTIRSTNLSSYSNTVTTYTPSKGYNTIKTVTTRTYNNGNTTNNTNNTYNTRPASETRTYTPTTTTNSSSSSSSSSSTITRPARGGR
jgi:hypothetical protein